MTRNTTPHPQPKKVPPQAYMRFNSAARHSGQLLKYHGNQPQFQQARLGQMMTTCSPAPSFLAALLEDLPSWVRTAVLVRGTITQELLL